MGKKGEKIKAWSACLPIGQNYSDFSQIVRDTALERREPYSGFIKRSIDGRIVTTFTRSLYPRQKYGIQTPQQCAEGMSRLAVKFHKTLEHTTERKGFRVVLGLLEGYDPMDRLHTIEEVSEKLPRLLTVDPVEIFAVRLGDDSAAVYAEPAAVIQGSLRYLKHVDAIAEALKQQRYAVEDQLHGCTYLVETSHCKEPDAPPMTSNLN